MFLKTKASLKEAVEIIDRVSTDPIIKHLAAGNDVFDDKMPAAIGWMKVREIAIIELDGREVIAAYDYAGKQSLHPVYMSSDGLIRVAVSTIKGKFDILGNYLGQGQHLLSIEF